MSDPITLKQLQDMTHRSTATSLAGYLLSVLLTAISFVLVYYQILTGITVMAVISVLALVQAALQLKCFLHLGEQPKPNWEAFVFGFMLLILVIVAAGSIWVMNDLNERMMEHHSEMMHD